MKTHRVSGTGRVFRKDREGGIKAGVKIRKYVFAALGCVCLGLGTVGIFLPVLPTTPLYLLTVFFFANSSQRLHDWFLGTGLYRKHLESFVKKRGMMQSTKISVICTVTLLMGFGFYMMARKGVWIPCIILAVVWVGHILYFTLCVKTIPQDEAETGNAETSGTECEAAGTGGERKDIETD